MMQKLKELRESNGMNMKEAAKALQMPYTTYVSYEKGDREPNSDVMVKIASFYGVTVDSLLGRGDLIPMPSSRRFPVIGAVACGKPIEAVQTSDYIDFPDALNADVCLVCKGDSMSPKYLDGDIVFIRRQKNVENGQIAAVYVQDGAEWSVTLKKVMLYPEKKTVILRALNPDYDDMIFTGSERSQLEIFGIAVALCRKA